MTDKHKVDYFPDLYREAVRRRGIRREEGRGKRGERRERRGEGRAWRRRGERSVIPLCRNVLLHQHMVLHNTDRFISVYVRDIIHPHRQPTYSCPDGPFGKEINDFVTKLTRQATTQPEGCTTREGIVYNQIPWFRLENSPQSHCFWQRESNKYTYEKQ